jgi:hypothetical protein
MNADVKESLTFVAHLKSEHRNLQRAIVEVVHESHGPAADLLEHLRQLRGQLARHFQDEDEGGCLEEAVARCPAVAEQAMWVTWEHPLLLEELDALIQQLASRNLVMDDWREDFMRFTKKLTAHEEAEDRIVSRALGVSA